MKAPGIPKIVVPVVTSIVCVAALVLVILFLAGTFNERIPPGEGKAVDPLPAPFTSPTTHEVTATEEDVIERYPGTVEAIREAVVSARIIAEVREVLVRPGSRVEKDDELVVLDDRELQARVKQSGEAVAAAEAQLKEAEANFRRMKEILETGAVSRQAYDQAESVYLSARAAVENARQRREEARVNLTYATIRAPFDAIVIDTFVEPGDVASPGAPLLKVYDPSALRLEAYVRESLAVGLETGQELEVSLDSVPEPFRGRVEEIIPQAEAGSRSFLVKVGLPAKEKIYPGMFGRLLLRTGPRTRLLVPEDAVVAIGQLSFVVLDDETRSRRLVVPGYDAPEGRVEILSGIEAGERILVPQEQ